MDESTKKIINYLNTNTFGADYVLTCVADIARAVGHNPRTVQIRLEKLIEDKIVTVEDCYPRSGRAMVFVYSIDRPKASKLVHRWESLHPSSIASV